MMDATEYNSQPKKAEGSIVDTLSSFTAQQCATTIAKETAKNVFGMNRTKKQQQESDEAIVGAVGGLVVVGAVQGVKLITRVLRALKWTVYAALAVVAIVVAIILINAK